MSKQRSVLFIHGAWSSQDTFRHMVEECGISEPNRYFLEYKTIDNRLGLVVNKGAEILSAAPKNAKFVVVGHSLGGLVALGLESHKKVSRVVTLAAPLGGVDPIMTACVLFRSVLQDAKYGSTFVRSLHEGKYTKPIDVVASCSGFSPFAMQPTDGVLTLRSQTAWLPETANLTQLVTGHHSILGDEEALKIVREAVSG